MTPFWIGLGIYLTGWVAFVVVCASIDGIPADTDDLGMLVPIGIMWPIWVVVGAVAGIARLILCALGKD